MNKKLLTYCLLVIAITFVGYNSVYFQQLDTHKSSTTQKFDATEFAKSFIANKLKTAMDSAIELQSVLQLLQTNYNAALNVIEQNKNSDIIKYVLVKSKGTVSAINGDNVVIKNTSTLINLSTEMLSGSAIRDVTGLIKLSEYDNSIQFNEVSTALNKLTYTNVILPFKQLAKIGMQVNYIGCIEINTEQQAVESIKIIPLKIF